VSAALAWLVAAGVALIIEMLTLDLIFLMLAVGAVGAAGVAALGAEIVLQVVTFAVISLVGLFAVRPLALRHLRGSSQAITNVDALVGQRALVLEAVDHIGGRVKIGGEVWSARVDAEPAEPIEVGTYVTVRRIDGATAVVHPEDSTQQTTSPSEA